MKIQTTSLQDVILLTPSVFRDDRGFFLESYNRREMAEAGIVCDFVQDNHSFSKQNVLRGLHYQTKHPQGKLVRTISGEVLDVAVDLRRWSPSFGKWASFVLSEHNARMLWIPPGFAHGFYVRSTAAVFLYKATAFYQPQCERTIVWNDSDLKIDWQFCGEPVVSQKDLAGTPFSQAPVFERASWVSAGA